MVEWKEIKGYENLYEISTDGQIRNMGTDKIIKQHIRNGYKSTSLYKNKKSNTKNVHRLMGFTFLELTVDKQINHMDGNKINNKLNNLEVVTAKGNTKHAKDTGLFKHHVKKVSQFDMDGNFVKEFSSIKDAEKETGVCNKHISTVCRGRRNSTGGFIWKYSDYEYIEIQKPKGKTIKKYPNYMITSNGKVYSKRMKEYLTHKVLPSGYETVKLCNSEGTKDMYIRTLLADYYPKKKKKPKNKTNDTKSDQK